MGTLRRQKKGAVSARYSIGEWYGKTFSKLSREERKEYADIQGTPSADVQPCPFKYPSGQLCTKRGGVCSIRLYERKIDTVSVAEGNSGMLRATCPYRFQETNKIASWIGENLLRNSEPLVAKEVGFLRPLRTIGASRNLPFTDQTESAEEAEKELKEEKDIGRIDMILVHPDLQHLEWCAVEIQAVYFSGPAFGKEFPIISSHVPPPDIPWPTFTRRPDYRSSGPKRLLPQLQIKTDEIRRWGKRIAVVIDHGFFDALAEMRFQRDISNADIAWFVVRFEESQNEYASMVLDNIYFTRLEDSIQGLTGGRPITKSEFEASLLAKLKA